MYLGKIVEIADADELNDYPQHPYTTVSALCGSDPGSEYHASENSASFWKVMCRVRCVCRPGVHFAPAAGMRRKSVQRSARN